MVTDIGFIELYVAILHGYFLPELHKVNQTLKVECIVMAICENQIITKGSLDQSLQLFASEWVGLLIDKVQHLMGMDLLSEIRFHGP
jgi:hypothetical protein